MLDNAAPKFTRAQIISGLRRLLQSCEEFKVREQVEILFIEAELDDYRTALSWGNNVVENVDFFITTFIDRWCDGQNVLARLVDALAKHYKPSDPLYQWLTEAAAAMHELLRPPVSPFLAASPGPAGPQLVKIVPQMGASTPASGYFAVDRLLLKRAESVCHIEVPRSRVNMLQKYTGTGWVITPGLVVTCLHVLEARDKHEQHQIIEEPTLRHQVENAHVTFAYEQPDQGIVYTAELIHHDRSLDYALIRLHPRQDPSQGANTGLPIDLNPPLTLQTQLCVVQHPRETPMQRAIGRFDRKTDNGLEILHTAQTDNGTSGAPVLFHPQWRVGALHRGQVPNSALRSAILIDQLMRQLAQRNRPLYDEILTYQKTLQQQV